MDDPNARGQTGTPDREEGDGDDSHGLVEVGSEYDDKSSNSSSRRSPSSSIFTNDTSLPTQNGWDDANASSLGHECHRTSGITTPDTEADTVPSSPAITDLGKPDETRTRPIVHTALGPARLAIGLNPRPSLLSTAREGDCLFVNDFFEVRKSPLGGWGAFAVRDLWRGEHILIERALIHAYDSNLMEAFDRLDYVNKQVVLDLHAHNPVDSSVRARVFSAWHTNNFACTGDRRGDGLFPIASRFNHACSPKCNVRYCYDWNQKVLVFTIFAPVVKAGEELTISYGKDPDILKQKYGFECRCGGCEGAYRNFLAREYGTTRW